MEEQAGIERRRAQRYDYPSTIEFCPEVVTCSPQQRAVTINISSLGLCAYLFNTYPRGAKLYLKSELPVKHCIATVQWVRQKEDGLFLTGLHFIDTPQTV